MDEKLRLVTKPVELNVMGLDANSFVMLVAFHQAARRQHTPQTEIEAVLKEAKLHDYDHVVQVLLANTVQTDNDNFDYENDYEGNYETDGGY